MEGIDDEDEELEFTYHQTDCCEEWNNRILIDSQSTIDVFKNREYLTDIKTVKKGCKIQCNAGIVMVNKKGMFGSIPVWYHPEGVANILSLKTLKNKCHVTYDSNDEGGIFRVAMKNGIIKFIPHANGLHYLEMNPKEESAVTLVTRIQDNLKGFPKKEIEGAKKAQEFQAMVGHPSRRDLKKMVRANLIANCPITENDVANADAIFGDNLAGLRGKTTRKKSERVTTDYVKISKEFLRMHEYITLMADVMFVNNIGFVVTFGRGIGLLTFEFTPTHTANQLARNLNKVIQLHG